MYLHRKAEEAALRICLTFPQPFAPGQLNGPASPAASQEARASSAWHLQVSPGPFSTAESQPSGSGWLFSI